MKFLLTIWPTIYKVINGLFYFLINLTKSIIVYGIRQIKGTS